MPERGRREWLLAVIVLVAIAAGSGAAAAAVGDGPPAQVADCTASPTTVTPGENVTLDVSSSDASFVRFDKEGDGTYERVDETDFVENFTYQDVGTYDPVVLVNDETTAPCGTVTVTEPPVAELSVAPNPAVTGEEITFDASESFDADGDIVEYRWDFDGDGTVDRTTNTSTTDSSYAQAATYLVSVTVVDNAGETDTAVRDVGVEEAPVAACTVEPSSATPGETVTIDATASENAALVDYDTDGDGEYDVFEQTNFTTDTQALETSFTPGVRVYRDSPENADTADCGTVDIESANEPPEPVLSISPRPGIVGQPVTFDGSSSVDPDGQVVEYRWDFDGDGTVDNITTSPRTEHTYTSADGYAPLLTVVDDDGAAQTIEDEYEVVESPNEPPEAAFTVDPAGPTTGDQVTFDGSNSVDPDGQIVEYRWDFDGDGTVDNTTTSPRVQHTYTATGGQVPILTVVDDDGATDSAERDLFVEQRLDETTDGTGGIGDETPEEPSSGIPWGPIGIGGGALGIGGLLWYFLGGGGGGGGAGSGSKPKPKPKPKPTPGEDDRIRYETGVFALPATSGIVSVPVGFEPDLVLLSVRNGARTDVAVDRTAGGSFGVVHATRDGLRNQCLTVADDAQSTDQATCAVADDRALQLVRHSTPGPPGRVTGTVADTTADGFDLNVSVPGDDPLAGGVRVLYQAFSTTSDVGVEVGHFMTPTEPGTQTVDLGINADHVSLTTSAAVTDTDQLWTTNRGVGLSVGNVVAEEESLDQTVWGASAWPETDHANAAVCRTDRALHLLYQDAGRVAGRTSASVTSLGATLRLLYDRVYNGPHKLGSTARHPVSYLAMAGGEKMRPAIGTFEFPGAGESVSVDCGFGPTMVELVVSTAPLGEEVPSGASARPFDVSHGTAIDTGDGLRQYVVHHSVVAAPPAARSDVSAGEPTTQAGGTAADGGQQRERASTTTPDIPAGDTIDDVPVDDTVGQVPTADASSAGEQDGDAGVTAPDPTETSDDGRAGLWLPQTPDGTIIGRDELQVQRLTESGFDVTVESFDTDGRSGNETTPTVVYRAWPAVDGERNETTGADTASTDATGESTAADTQETEHD